MRSQSIYPQRLKGKVAIVTGGSAGLGRSVCLALAREGASVVIVGRNKQRLAEVAQSIRKHFQTDTLELKLDVLNDSDMETMSQTTVERFGQLDILVSSAGILRPANLGMKTLAQTPVEAWDAVVNTNLKGLFLCLRSVIPQMLKQRSGDIISISSKSAIKGLAFDSAYCASKSGMIGLTEAVAQEVNSSGVRIQTLLPGTFDTDLWDQNSVMARPPNLPPPERVAEIVVQMISMPRDSYLSAPIVEPMQTIALPEW